MRVSVLDMAGRKVYYPYMASIVGKKRGNQTYYYLVESARVDGKPRIVDQQYLGSAEEVMARLSGAPQGSPERTQHKKFGDLAAVWGILARLKVTEAIDEVCGARRSDAAASVGTYLALATLNRVVEPRSKLGFAQWWASTAGPRFTKVPVAATDHRRFWDAMDHLDTDKLAAAERAISTAMVTEFGLDLSGLALDMTNFATFIDSTNEAAPIAQRGHAKQKRGDLRLVGLGLVVTRDGAIRNDAHTQLGRLQADEDARRGLLPRGQGRGARAGHLQARGRGLGLSPRNAPPSAPHVLSAAPAHPPIPRAVGSAVTDPVVGCGW